MPASRSGTRDAAELEKLVGTEINCRITKLDVTDEDVVVDRRIVLEEQARGLTAIRREAMKEGDLVTGTVRTLAIPYGAFVDLGGIDGLLHICDIAHARVAKPEDVLAEGSNFRSRCSRLIQPHKRSRSDSSSCSRNPGRRCRADSGWPTRFWDGHSTGGLRRICRD